MEKTLVVLAAGMGSRFGGLKQVEPVGPNGEFLLDYSVYDAKKAGFEKVVFIIKKENKDLFEETVTKRIKGIKIEYAYQEIDNLPIKVDVKREKPWGTAHALYCAKDKINGPFAIIASDDFYGYKSFELVSKYLDSNRGICVIGYPVGNTLSDAGEVKRGIILTENGKINAIKESKVILDKDKVKCTPLNGDDVFWVSKDTGASMLIDGFNNNILDDIEKNLIDFINSADLTKDEFLIPDLIDKYVSTGQVTSINTTETWMGITYKDDLQFVKNKILEYIKDGKYPENLWK